MTNDQAKESTNLLKDKTPKNIMEQKLESYHISKAYKLMWQNNPITSNIYCLKNYKL